MKILGVLAVFVIELAAVAVAYEAAAEWGGPPGPFFNEEKRELMEEKRELMEEKRELMLTALETRDYEMWAEQMNARIAEMEEFVTPENFELLVEMHEARQSGDFEKAKEIRAELGGPGGFPGMGCGGGFRGRGMFGPREFQGRR
jgi:hypothetical protein